MKRLVIAFLVALVSFTASAQFNLPIGPSSVVPVGPSSVLGVGSTVYLLPGAVQLINMFPAATAPVAFENATWTKNNIQDVTFATKIKAPDGSVTAEKIIANSANAGHSIVATTLIKGSSVQSYRLIVDAQQGATGEYTRILLGTGDGSGLRGVETIYDLAAGQIGKIPTSFGAGFSGSNATVTPIGNGFYRCAFDMTSNANAGLYVYVEIDAGSGTGAKNVTFSGDGVKGIYAWQINVLPLAAWALINKTFSDPLTSLSTIDINNTKVAGFLWYVNNAWPNAGDGGSLSLPWRGANPQQPGDFTSDGASVTGLINRSGNVMAGIDQTLTSAVTDGGTGYIGKVFTLPMYMEATWATDTTLATTTATAWPIQWTFALEYLTGSTTRPIESDMTEYLPNGAGTVSADDAFHDWTISGSSETSNVQTNAHPTFGVTTTNQNRYGSLWLSQAATGSTGLRQLYINGVYVSGTDVTYSSSAASSGATPSNPVGTFAQGDTQHFPFMLSAGTGAGGVGNWPVTWTGAVVYQQAAPLPCRRRTDDNRTVRRHRRKRHANDNSPVGLNEVG